jgi:hypothetical protein
MMNVNQMKAVIIIVFCIMVFMPMVLDLININRFILMPILGAVFCSLIYWFTTSKNKTDEITK